MVLNYCKICNLQSFFFTHMCRILSYSDSRLRNTLRWRKILEKGNQAFFLNIFHSAAQKLFSQKLMDFACYLQKNVNKETQIKIKIYPPPRRRAATQEDAESGWRHPRVFVAAAAAAVAVPAAAAVAGNFESAPPQPRRRPNAQLWTIRLSSSRDLRVVHDPIQLKTAKPEL